MASQDEGGGEGRDEGRGEGREAAALQEARIEEAAVATPVLQLRLLLVVLTLAGMWIARDFVLELAWAVVMAVALWPLYRRLAPPRKEGRHLPIVAPLVVTLGTGLILMLPLAIVAVEAARDSQAAMAWVTQAQQHGLPAPPWLSHMPLAGDRAVGWWNGHLATPQAAANLLGRLDAGAIAKWTETLARELASRSMFFAITLLALFIILRDGERLANKSVDNARRFYGDFGERFVMRLADAIRGAVNGTVFVAIGEGTLIGFAYAALGVPRPVLFAVITIGFAMLPFGAWAAFGVASLVLLVQGHVVGAVILLVFGAAVMLIGDNIVQPALIGNSVELPFLWTLVATFGGLETFGLVGLFIGPAIMAALFLVWREWLGEDVVAGSRRRHKRAQRAKLRGAPGSGPGFVAADGASVEEP
ncbi:MAG TPA: AI-2E family transporter [Allosphingosinicella sp.]|jgi:predicted PurR-regulated permease PerM